MAKFKTMQFPNSAKGQRDKAKALEKASEEGWELVSETIVSGKFKGGKACCFALIFLPCAFLAGHTSDVIQITLRKD